MADYDFPWEQAAMNGEDMPAGLSPAEQCAFQATALLYARFRLKAIDRETGHKEKLEIKRTLEQRLGADASADRLTQYHVELRKKIELAHIAYRKERTIGAADRLSAVLDGFE